MVVWLSRRWPMQKYVFLLVFSLMILLMFNITKLHIEEQVDNRSNVVYFGDHVKHRRMILDTEKHVNKNGYSMVDNNIANIINTTPNDPVEIVNIPLDMQINILATKSKYKAQTRSALDAALLVTQKTLAEHSGRESLTNKLAQFKTVMSSEERKLLLDIAKTMDHITKEWNITYFLYGGSLLGSYRHHDIIPWDDDLDVFVNLKDRYTMFRAISASPNYDVFLAGSRMKMWSKDSQSITKYPWGWPYVDISFYEENDTHIWDSSKEYSDYVYPKSIVFPLHKRPLAGYFYQAPRDSFANLKLTYKSVDCTTHHYSHKYEKRHKRKRKVTIPCELMYNGIPFVYRTKCENGVRETLMLGDSVLHSLIVDEPSYAISEPFKLELVKT